MPHARGIAHTRLRQATREAHGAVEQKLLLSSARGAAALML
jgi:hypothetical protein